MKQDQKFKEDKHSYLVTEAARGELGFGLGNRERQEQPETKPDGFALDKRNSFYRSCSKLQLLRLPRLITSQNIPIGFTFDLVVKTKTSTNPISSREIQQGFTFGLAVKPKTSTNPYQQDKDSRNHVKHKHKDHNSQDSNCRSTCATSVCCHQTDGLSTITWNCLHHAEQRTLFN